MNKNLCHPEGGADTFLNFRRFVDSGVNFVGAVTCTPPWLVSVGVQYPPLASKRWGLVSPPWLISVGV